MIKINTIKENQKSKLLHFFVSINKKKPETDIFIEKIYELLDNNLDIDLKKSLKPENNEDKYMQIIAANYLLHHITKYRYDTLISLAKKRITQINYASFYTMFPKEKQKDLKRYNSLIKKLKTRKKIEFLRSY